MKIAFVNEGIYEFATGAAEAAGGLERDQWLLSRTLAAHGWTAVIGVIGALKAGQHKIIDGVEYVGLRQERSLLAWRQFLSRERPDWLFWEGAGHLWGPLVEIANLIGVRTIFHTAFDTDVQPRQALDWRRRWWPLYAWGLFRSDRIFVQHSGQLMKLPSRLQSRACVLPKVCGRSENGETPVAIPHIEREKYVAWVAVLRQPKRPDVLVEIARRAPEVRFVVCGGPSSHRSHGGFGQRIVNELRTLPNVDYRGHVSPGEAAKVITNAALLLSTSDQEGFPNTFTQAWSSGTPVVSLKIDPDHIIQNVGLGKISGSVENAIADITSLLCSPQQREEIAVRARRHIAEIHSEAAVLAVFERALCGLPSGITPCAVGQ